MRGAAIFWLFVGCWQGITSLCPRPQVLHTSRRARAVVEGRKDVVRREKKGMTQRDNPPALRCRLPLSGMFSTELGDIVTKRKRRGGFVRATEGFRPGGCGEELSSMRETFTSCPARRRQRRRRSRGHAGHRGVFEVAGVSGSAAAKARGAVRFNDVGSRLKAGRTVARGANLVRLLCMGHSRRAGRRIAQPWHSKARRDPCGNRG